MPRIRLAVLTSLPAVHGLVAEHSPVAEGAVLASLEQGQLALLQLVQVQELQVQVLQVRVLQVQVQQVRVLQVRVQQVRVLQVLQPPLV